MSNGIDWTLEPEELGAPTDGEITGCSARVSPAASTRLKEAAFVLTIAKMRGGDKTPWRALVDAYRKTEPVRTEIDVVDDAGQPRVQIAYIERGYGLKGNDALMFNAVSELARALDLIDQERERNRSNGAGGGPKPKNAGEAIAGYLKRRDYESSLNKKALVMEAAAHFKVGETTIRNAITKHGLANRR